MYKSMMDSMKKPMESKMAKSGDPEPKKTTSVKVYGASEKGGEKTLASATVTGKREKLPAYIYSDELKSKRWKQNSLKGFSTEELPRTSSDFSTNESHWMKKPGAKGNIEVHYSDGGKAKLGEKYVPKDTPGPSDDVNGGWREWHKSSYPEQYQE